MPKDQIFDDQSPFSASTRFPPPPQKQWIGLPAYSSAGFTLVELLVVSGIIVVLVTLALPVFKEFIDRARGARTKQEIRLLETEIADYQVLNGVLPANLAAINRGALNDPWGHGYVYSTALTRNRFGNLLNDDFDLCSMGKDGSTEAEIFGGGGTGKDDLVRGRNGAFLGLGADW